MNTRGSKPSGNANVMSTRRRYLRSTGLPSGGGGTCGGFLPTTIASTGGLTSFAVVSPASRLAVLEDALAKRMKGGSGTKCVEFARYSAQHGCWLKTSQGYYQQEMFKEGGGACSEEWSETWPRSGIVSNGTAYRRPPLVPRISGTGCSFWGTVQAHERAQSPRKVDHGVQLANQVAGITQTPSAETVDTDGTIAPASCLDHLSHQIFPTPAARDWRSDSSPQTDAGLYGKKGKPLPRAVGGQLSPGFAEWLMGFPKDWTKLEE